jgi:hypothetical protein
LKTFAFALVLACAPAAFADIIQLTFSGPIAFSNMTAFPVNQTVTVTFAYQSAGAQQFVGSQQAFYIDHLLTFNLASGSYNSSDNSGPYGQIDKYDNLANTDGISFQVAANPLTYQYTNPKPQGIQLAPVFSNAISQTFDTLSVNLASNSNAVWNDYTLPTSYNFASFDQTQNVGISFSNGSFQARFTSLTAQNLTAAAPAPEPGTLGLLGLGVVIAAARLRRRA